MGKKKSKVGKQRQAKAIHHGKRNNSSASKASTIGATLGGVTVSKGISSKFQQHSKSGNSTIILDINNNNKTKQRHMKSAHSNANSRASSSKSQKVFLSPSGSTAHSKASSQSSAKVFNEQEEFGRQMASMLERHAAAKNSGTTKKKSVLLKEGAVTNVISKLQPASFSIDKSTTDMMQEAVQQMQSLTGVGHQTAESLKTPVRNNQSWAVINKDAAVLNNNNPFAALEQDSDDEAGQQELQKWGMPIQLAPPSFSLLPRTTPTPAPTPLREFGNAVSVSSIDDIDPDL